jgi:hypothetical protein
MKTQIGPHTISLPILITCWESVKAQGETLVLRPRSGDARLFRAPMNLPVRRFTDADFIHAQALMGDGGTKRFIALSLLQTATASKKREDIERAREMLCAALASDRQLIESIERSLPLNKQRKKRKPIHPKGSMWDDICRALYPDLTDEAEMLTKRYLTEDPASLFAMEMTGALTEGRLHLFGGTSGADTCVQLVLWRVGTRLMPALYCASVEIAAYATALFGRRWKVCPYSACEKKWFIPIRSTQDYCCRAHREAHRVARWRKRQKAKSKRHST